MEPKDITTKCYDFVGKKKSTNFLWMAIMASFMMGYLIKHANLGLKSDKGFKQQWIQKLVLRGRTSLEGIADFF